MTTTDSETRAACGWCATGYCSACVTTRAVSKPVCGCAERGHRKRVRA